MHTYNFEARGSNLKTLLRVVPRGRHDNAGTIFWGTSPLKIWERKNRPEFGAILDNSRLQS